ncbi:hypothetical protein QCA50_000723 [Cerrena zonata]|uniref:Calcineurin-like phosphoesterase domain-containing protein n=1 Tax=Cerrena zonata TaxID=2478898 RepID=A0AAW0GRF5_9APHY
MSMTMLSETAVVHMQYDLDNVPSLPDPDWTRFVCISDTHCQRFPIPDGDVLLHGGDLTHTGTLKQFETTVDWLKGLPHPVKIVVGGNHDLTLDNNNNWYDTNFQHWHLQGKEDVQAIRELLLGNEAKERNLIYLQDELFEFRTKDSGRLWSVYGSPWSPYFGGWAFNYPRAQAQRYASAIPKADILLTHGPPFGIFDRVNTGELVGCEALLSRVAQLRPRLHLFGHIHEDHGAVVCKWSSNDQVHGSETVFVNGANWPAGNKAYLPSGERTQFGMGPCSPVIVDLKDSI